MRESPDVFAREFTTKDSLILYQSHGIDVEIIDSVRGSSKIFGT